MKRRQRDFHTPGIATSFHSWPYTAAMLRYSGRSMSDRLETLRSLVTQDPSNTRVHYMLCMELVNTGALEAAAQEFTALLTANPDYGAGYYHGGQTLEKLGRAADARALYRQGIEATTRSGDSHTRSELEGVLSMLG